MQRLRRLLRQAWRPCSSYDPFTDCYLVPVSSRLLHDMDGEWSEPVQLRVVRHWNASLATDVHLEVRRMPRNPGTPL